MAFCSSFGLGILHLFKQSWGLPLYKTKAVHRAFPSELFFDSQNTWRLVPSTITSLQLTGSDMLFKGKEFSLKCMLTVIHKKGISFGLLKIFLISNAWAIEQITSERGSHYSYPRSAKALWLLAYLLGMLIIFPNEDRNIWREVVYWGGGGWGGDHPLWSFSEFFPRRQNISTWDMTS